MAHVTGLVPGVVCLLSFLASTAVATTNHRTSDNGGATGSTSDARNDQQTSLWPTSGSGLETRLSFTAGKICLISPRPTLPPAAQAQSAPIFIFDDFVTTLNNGYPDTAHTYDDAITYEDVQRELWALCTNQAGRTVGGTMPVAPSAKSAAAHSQRCFNSPGAAVSADAGITFDDSSTRTIYPQRILPHDDLDSVLKAQLQAMPVSERPTQFVDVSQYLNRRQIVSRSLPKDYRLLHSTVCPKKLPIELAIYWMGAHIRLHFQHIIKHVGQVVLSKSPATPRAQQSPLNCTPTPWQNSGSSITLCLACTGTMVLGK